MQFLSKQKWRGIDAGTAVHINMSPGLLERERDSSSTKIRREAEDREFDTWKKLKSLHQWCQVPGEQIAPSCQRRTKIIACQKSCVLWLSASPCPCLQQPHAGQWAAVGIHAVKQNCSNLPCVVTVRLIFLFITYLGFSLLADGHGLHHLHILKGIFNLIFP